MQSKLWTILEKENLLLCDMAIYTILARIPLCSCHLVIDIDDAFQGHRAFALWAFLRAQCFVQWWVLSALIRWYQCPKRDRQILKDGRVFSFAALDDRNGLFSCMRTSKGVGSDLIDEYSRRAGNAVFLQCKIVKVFKAKGGLAFHLRILYAFQLEFYDKLCFLG